LLQDPGLENMYIYIYIYIYIFKYIKIYFLRKSFSRIVDEVHMKEVECHEELRETQMNTQRNSRGVNFTKPPYERLIYINIYKRYISVCVARVLLHAPE